uniref:Uncharacterized protein n=1 Tax=Oryza barthii TaxID=65489 RepID=A0A0D3GLQ4_9ORYZ
MPSSPGFSFRPKLARRPAGGGTEGSWASSQGRWLMSAAGGASVRCGSMKSADGGASVRCGGSYVLPFVCVVVLS